MDKKNITPVDIVDSCIAVYCEETDNNMEDVGGLVILCRVKMYLKHGFTPKDHPGLSTADFCSNYATKAFLIGMVRLWKKYGKGR